MTNRHWTLPALLPIVAVAVGALAAPASAQTVSTSIAAVTPLLVRAADAGPVQTSTLPAGPLFPSAGMSVTVPGTTNGVDVAWSTASSALFARTILTYQLTNTTGSAAFQGHAGPHEFLLEFTSPTAVPVELQLSRQELLSPGAPFPLVKVDYGADGTVDVVSLPVGLTTEPLLQVGPQALRVRLLVEADLTGVGSSTTWLTIAAMPRNDLQLTTSVQACASFFPPPPPVVLPTFLGTGVLLTVPQTAFETSVFVVGFGAQPLLLGTSAIGPCILLPTPDVVFFDPAGQVPVALPPSVRPLQFYVQGVTLTAVGLQVTDGVRVTAW